MPPTLLSASQDPSPWFTTQNLPAFPRKLYDFLLLCIDTSAPHARVMLQTQNLLSKTLSHVYTDPQDPNKPM